MKYLLIIVFILNCISISYSQSCIALTNPSYSHLLVNNTNTEGKGSLRQAILCANSHLSFDTIYFNIPTTDPNYVNPDGIANNGDEYFNLTLAVNDLPTVTDTLLIDGLTQVGSSCNQNLLPVYPTQSKGFKPRGLKFVVNGGGLSKQGIDIESSATLLIIKGLVFVNWVNGTTNGNGVVRLKPLSPSSLIRLDCSFMANKI